MVDFNPLSTSHIFAVLITVALIVLLPKLFENKSVETKNILILSIITLMLINHVMDFYYEGYLSEIKLGLPLHLCDFSSASVMLYFLTKRKIFFLFAFFAGISGAGMAILTPDTQHGFPNIHYIRHMVGHAMILLGVSYAIIIDNQSPYLKDVHRVLMVLSVFLVVIYFINYLLGPPANYWYLGTKPIGESILDFFPEPPLHIPLLIIIGAVLFFIIYSPYWIYDKFKRKDVG